MPIYTNELFKAINDLALITFDKSIEYHDIGCLKKLLEGYCADCGSRMWLHKSTNKVPVRHFFCSNYKGMRGTCNDHHYIREDALTEVVLSELRRLAAFLACDEDAFAELLRQKTDADMMAEQKRLEAGLAAAQARNAEVLKLYERIYEDNVNGKVSDEWFMQLSQKYEEEKAELKKQIFDLTERLNRLSGMQTAKDGFIRAIRSFMQMETLTPTVLHELVERIDIHAVQVLRTAFSLGSSGENRRFTVLV